MSARFTDLHDRDNASRVPDQGWLPHGRPAWQRYGAAIVLTVLAIWIRIALAPADSGGRFVTASLAVVLSALFGGVGPGILSTALGTVLVNFFLVAPYGTLAIDNPSEAFWLNAWHLLTQAVVIGTIGIMQRQNRHMQDVIREAQLNQQRFLDTFEHAASGISHVDINGHLLRTNQTFCDMIGYSKEELETLRFQDITHPDDLAPDLALLQEALAGRRSAYTLVKRYFHKDGHTVWAQLTVALVRKAHGQPDYFISVAQDISAQKSAEEALRTSKNLLDQAQKLARMGAWQADMETSRISALPGSSTFLSFPRGDYAISEVLQHIHPSDQPRVQKQWARAVKGEVPYEIEYRVLLEGKEYWHSVKAEFERDDKGNAVRALGVTLDITDRKRIELEFQRLNASLEQRIQDRTRALRDAYDELESYSYAVAHDLRSPLRIINGFAQALKEDQPDLGTAAHDHLSRIMAASKKMGELIDGLLKLSQYGRGEVQRVPLSISGIAQHQLDELTTADPLRHVDWSVEPDIEVLADPPLIEALMQNLLHNAWKYTSAAPRAQIRVFTELRDGARFICVSDNGAGFDMGRADKLFQPFQRLHQPNEFAGLGIGLATARLIVQRHGGVLEAHSAPGQGATFSFTLPS
ncbi:PAS domain S-box protein [Hydrogenophaga sp. RWCD_12]|uniref:PAS domain S-box protein n=1 Tax=Hydrogenophaga sp. RWCD_12 TaxID=3391190 RepID=UPI003984F972